MVILPPRGHLQQVFLRVAFGPHFNLYTHHLSAQIPHVIYLLMLTIQPSLKVISKSGNRAVAAIEINDDLNRACLWGKKWNIIFEPDKCHSLYVLLKRDADLHPPLYMDALPITEVEVLKILGIYFDHKFTWNQMIDQLATLSWQKLGAIYRVKDYLGQGGLSNT